MVKTIYGQLSYWWDTDTKGNKQGQWMLVVTRYTPALCHHLVSFITLFGSTYSAACELHISLICMSTENESKI